ncbi:MAG TPA: PIN domain-containing protein [Ktedonobacterales bacterium]|nr:PIN domain-containing protein [Ktedonobacterales bacterium]
MARYPLLDTNVFLRHLRQDHADFSPRATAYFEQIARGDLVVETSQPVIFETVYTLQSFYKQTKADIRATLLPLVALPGIRLPNKRRLRRTFTLYVDYNLSFVDAYQAAFVLERGHPALVSFDRNYDRVPGVPRVEP